VELKFKFKTKRVLVISDTHCPYHHKDMFAFLKALKKKYKPHLVVSLGDLVDWHSISFHPKSPELLSPGDELNAIRKAMKELEKLFPKMIIIGSNHGDLPLRKMKDAGMPLNFLRPYNEMYGVGKGWTFCDDLTLLDGEEVIYFAHGITKDGRKLAAQRGVNVVQGHFHCQFRIDYISNPRNLLWSMSAGCLIDREALAFEYGKLTLDRPLIGTGMILSGLPKLEPMLLKPKGRWVGKLL
jgi:hypothetical protein